MAVKIEMLGLGVLTVAHIDGTAKDSKGRKAKVCRKIYFKGESR